MNTWLAAFLLFYALRDIVVLAMYRRSASRLATLERDSAVSRHDFTVLAKEMRVLRVVMQDTVRRLRRGQQN